MTANSIITSGAILLAGVLAYFILGTIFRRLISQAVHKSKITVQDPDDAKKREQTLIGLFNTLWKIGMISIIALVLLKNTFPEIDLSPLFASAGIIGIALGFGAQSIVKDLISGVFIVSDNQFRVGDVVDIEGFSGTVERIGIRSTVLRDVEGNVHYFPNGMIMHVINKTMGFSVTRFRISVSPDSDIDKVTKIINETGQKIAESAKWKDKILEAPKFAAIEEITGSFITVIISGKTLPSEQWAVSAEMRRRLLLELEKAEVKLAKIPMRGRV